MKPKVAWIIAFFVCGVLGLTNLFGRHHIQLKYGSIENEEQFRWAHGPEIGRTDKAIGSLPSRISGTADIKLTSSTDVAREQGDKQETGRIENELNPISVEPPTILPGLLLSFSIDGNRVVVGRQGDPGSLLPVDGLKADIVRMAGSGHSMALTLDGSIYTWGRNDSAGGGGGGSPPVKDAGQLGIPRESKPTTTPAKLLSTGPQGVEMVSIASGRYHSVAASKEGAVYTWGLNDFGQLGREGTDLENAICRNGSHCRSPQLAKIDWGDIRPVPKIIQVRAGRYFTLAVSSDGKVFTWGLNFCGEPEILQKVQSTEGGQPLNAHFHAKPKLIQGLGDAKIRYVDVGYVFTMLLDSEGRVWTCNSGSDGYAGQLPQYKEKQGIRPPNQEGELGRVIKQPKDGLVPSVVEGLPPNIVKIATGRCFGLALTKTGSVHHWGCAFFGGNKPSIKKLPSVGKGAQYGPAISLAAGEYHAHVVLENGKVLILGRSQNSESDAMGTILEGSEGFFVTEAECGNQHSFILAKKDTLDDQQSVKEHQMDAKDGSLSSADGHEAQSKTDQDLTQQEPFLAYNEAIHRNKPHHFGQGLDAIPRVHSAYVGKYEKPQQGLIDETIRDALEDVKEFDSAYRNPCYRARDGRFRCLPYFSIIGVSKSGTTDLYAKMEKFKNIMTSRNKGPHFWDEDHPWDWYLEVYDDVAKFLKDPKTSNNTITCDASSNTFSYSGVGVRGSKNDQVLLPEVLKSIQPEMKLVLMLRDPVKRMFSAYWYYGCLYGVYSNYGDMSSQNFHAFATDNIKTLKKCMVEDGYSARYCAVSNFGISEQLVKGMYAMTMLDWLSVYPKDMIKIIKLEEFAEKPAQHLKEVLSFLDFPEPSEQELESAVRVEANRGNTFSQKRPECQKKRDSMLPETKKLLQDFYRPFNHHLAKILDRPEFKWDY